MNLLEKLRDDHQAFLAAADLLDTLADRFGQPGYIKEDDGRMAAQTLDGLMPRVRRHEDIEHSLLFPALIRFDPESRAVIELLEREHHEIFGLMESSVSSVLKAPERPPNWLKLLIHTLTHPLRSHILREEREIFDRAEKNVPWRELEKLREQSEAR